MATTCIIEEMPSRKINLSPANSTEEPAGAGKNVLIAASGPQRFGNEEVRAGNQYHGAMLQLTDRAGRAL